MLSLPATLAWYLFLLVILLLFQRLTRWFTQLNIFSLALGFMVLRHGLTVPFDHTVNQWYAGIDISPAAYARFYTSLVLMWSSLLVGTYLARITLGSAILDPITLGRRMRDPKLPEGVNLWFVGLLAVGVGLVAYFNLRPQTDLLRLLSGGMSPEEYRNMRDTYGTATHYSAGLGNRLASIVRFGVYPTLLCTLFFLSRRRRGWFYAFLVTLLVGLLVGLLSGQKGPVAFLLLALAIAAYYRSGRVRLRLMNWRIWAVVLGGVLLIAVLYQRQYSGQSLVWALQASLYRLTSESNRSLQLYFQIYPDVEPFLHGHSSGLINSFTGVNIPVDELPERFIPIYYLGPEYLNTWNAAFIGVAWADFAYAGVVIESIFVGGLLFAYAWWFRRARPTALVLGTQVGLMMSATRLSEVALSGNLLTFGLLTSFAFYVVSRQPQRRIVPLPASPRSDTSVGQSDLTVTG